MTIKIHAQRYYQHLTPFHLFFVQEFFLVSWARLEPGLRDSTFGFTGGRLLGNSFFRRIVEEFDDLGDRSKALLTWYFVKVLLCGTLYRPFRSVK